MVHSVRLYVNAVKQNSKEPELVQFEGVAFGSDRSQEVVETGRIAALNRNVVEVRRR